MVDRRGRKNLYDAQPGHPQDGAAAAVLTHSEHPPLQQGGGPVCKGVFRSTLFPPDPRQEKDSGLPELVEAAFFGRDPGITLL